jgi:hypothetical protein
MFSNRSVFRTVTLSLAVAGSFATAAVAFAQALPADLDPVSNARVPYRTRADLGTGGERLANIFARNGKPTDPIKGPLAFSSYNVPVATALLDLHDGAVGKDSTLDAHVRELAIMVACRETNYTLEWNGHEAAALKAGVDPKVIDIVDEKDAAVIRFGRELIGARKMSSGTFAKAKELFGNTGALDLVAVMSTYAVSGFYAIAVDEHPGGKQLEAAPAGH